MRAVWNVQAAAAEQGEEALFADESEIAFARGQIAPALDFAPHTDTAVA